MKKDKLLRITMYALLFILIAVFIIRMCPIVLQNDTLYDIKLGERYLHTGMFRIDDYSFHANLVYQTHHFLVCIIDYIVYHLFSFQGLYILENILLSIIFLLFYLINKDKLKNKFLMIMLTFFPILALYSFVSLRAQMYSYIILLLELLTIEKYLNNNKKKHLIILTLLPLLLINLHSGVIYFYFIIMGTYLLNFFKMHFIIIESDERVGKDQFKNLIITSIIGLCLTLINPYGIDGITYGLKTLNSYYITHHIVEFQSFNLLKSYNIMIVIYFLFHLMCLVFSKKTIKIHELLLFLGTTFMTYTSIRHFSLLIVTSIVLMPHVESVYNRINNKDFSFFQSFKMGFTPMNIIISFFYLFTLSYLTFGIIDRQKNPLPADIYPIKGTNYIKKNISPDAHILNQYSWGSYLMFNDIKVFVDSRCDLYNTEYNKGITVFKDYVDLLYNNVDYKYIVNKYDIDYVMFSNDYGILKTILANSSNQAVYKDEQLTIVKVN
jgi:hypothetical protein